MDQQDNVSGAPGDAQTPVPSILEQEWDWSTHGQPEVEEETAAADEPEPEEPEVEEAPEEDDTPEPPEPEEETPTERKLRLRDGTEVSESDLKKAYGEQKDFQRERDAYLAEKAQFAQHAAQIRQQEQFFAQQMPHVLDTLRQQIPPPPDPSLRDTDPITFFLQKDAHEGAVNQFQRAQHAAQAHRQQTSAAQQQAFEQFRQVEMTRLVEVMPELKDRKVVEQFDTDMRDAARHYGFTEKDYAEVVDHRSLRVLADASKWRRLQAQKPKAIEKAKEAPPVVQAPARRRSTSEVQAQNTREQLSRLAKDGSRQSAEAFLSRFE